MLIQKSHNNWSTNNSNVSFLSIGLEWMWWRDEQNQNRNVQNSNLIQKNTIERMLYFNQFSYFIHTLTLIESTVPYPSDFDWNILAPRTDGNTHGIQFTSTGQMCYVIYEFDQNAKKKKMRSWTLDTLRFNASTLQASSNRLSFITFLVNCDQHRNQLHFNSYIENW